MRVMGKGILDRGKRGRKGWEELETSVCSEWYRHAKLRSSQTTHRFSDSLERLTELTRSCSTRGYSLLQQEETD